MSGKSLEMTIIMMTQMMMILMTGDDKYDGDFGVADGEEDNYLAKTSERDGSKKVDDELKIACRKNFLMQNHEFEETFGGPLGDKLLLGELCVQEIILEDLCLKAIVL